jgi:7-cyano-7-deazaguanine reductase
MEEKYMDNTARDRKEEGLVALGRHTEIPSTYNPAILETFENRHLQRDYWVEFLCPEFTTLCPITGQPDFAELRIRYIPDQKMVESKSLKLYFFGFRNHGDFHEDVVNIILDDLVRLLEPRYMEVQGIFAPRGGIAIHPFVNYGIPHTRYEELAIRRLASYEN